MNNYKIIDIENWKRKTHFKAFRDYVEPSYCITVELDITNFLKGIKFDGHSFTFSLIYFVAKCANEIEEFRYRFLDGDVVLFDNIDTSFTFIAPGDDVFKVVNVPMRDTLEKYVMVAKETAENQKEYFTGPMGNDIFQFSPIPWISYTHASHTISDRRDNATPIFTWGKYFKRDEKMFLPFSIQVHDSFVDALHVGRLVDKLQNLLSNYKVE